jgi:uncharacterized protein YacL
LSFRKKLFVVVCAIAGGVLMGRYAPHALEWLFINVFQVLEGKDPEELPDLGSPFNTGAIAVLGLMVGAGIAQFVIMARERTSEWWDDMDSGDRVTLFLGIFAGLIASMPFLFLLNSLQLGVYIPLAVAGLTLGFSTLSVYALRSMEEILPWHRGKGRGRRRGLKILDTNVLIDGRIYDVVRTGFMEPQLYVPGFILDELQYIADSHDPLRRQRGRRGIDVLRHLQADYNMEVRIHDRLAADLGDGVDARLVRLARALGADIITNDFNLNRIAGLQQVRVLNINDLALALRATVLPQETIRLSLIREGNQHGQGIGYLEDGTMVVVEGGKSHIGETIEVTVTQVIQTERGKLVFADAPGSEHGLEELTPRKRHAARRGY